MEKDNIMNGFGLSDDFYDNEENFVPADYNTQDIRRVQDRVNRILNGETADEDVPDASFAEDTVDISKISGEAEKNSAPRYNSINNGVDISSFSSEDKNYSDEYEPDENGVEDLAQIEDEPVPSITKKVVLGSVVAVCILLSVVMVLVIQAVVLPEDNVLTSAGIIEPETKPVIITNSAGEFIFSDNCKVDGVSLEGLTVEQAKEALADKEIEARPLMNITVDVDGKETIYNEDNFTFTYNTDEVLEKLKAFSEKYATGATMPTSKDEQGENIYTDSVGSITATLNKSSVDKLIKKIDKKYDKAPTDAQVTSFDPSKKDMFTYQEGKNGKELDEEELKEQFNAIITEGDGTDTYEGRVELKTTAVEPDADVQFLKDNMQLLAQWTTVSTNNANGNTNMAVSLKACNGSIINPGEIWSFNDCTGDSNDPSNGYKPAGVIVEGSYTDGYGGGICQSSTTIFNAAVRSNLEIYERNNHTYPSVYAASGFDAAIDYGNLDLKLRNNGKYQVFLSCYMSGTTLYATFYGIKEGKYDYIDTYSENYGITSTGYHSSSYRIYRDSNGNEIDREQLPDSYYSLENGHSVAAADSGGQSYVHGGPATGG